MKKVWFVSHYSMPPEYEKRVKTLKYAHYLNEWGYNTKIFACSVMHDYDKNLIEGNEKYVERKYDDLDFVHINCMRYGESFPKRIINHLQFAYRFCKIAKNFELPDVIVATDLNCINYKPICRFCKKNNIKLVADIRDLWPLSFVAYLGFSERNPLIRLLFRREKKMYRLSDAVVFSMEGGKDYIRDKGWDRDIDLNKIYYINNGVDLGEFDKNSKQYKLNDVDLNNEQIFKVVYTGSVRRVNGLEILVEAAEYLKCKHVKDIKILIYGEGDELAYLQTFANEKRLSNILFKGKVEKKYIPYVLSKSNLNFIHHQSGLEGVFKYGSSPNKLFDYLASGTPILSTGKTNYDLIEKFHAGFVLEDPTPQNIVDGILKFYNMDNEKYKRYCENAKRAAQAYDFKILSRRLEEVITCLK